MADRPPGRRRMERQVRDLSRGAAESIAAAVRRGAIVDPAAWVQRVLNADDPDEVVGVIDVLAGANNDTRQDESFAWLWPPKDGAEADRRARLAASAARSWTDDEVYARLYGEEPPE